MPRLRPQAKGTEGDIIPAEGGLLGSGFVSKVGSFLASAEDPKLNEHKTPAGDRCPGGMGYLVDTKLPSEELVDWLLNPNLRCRFSCGSTKGAAKTCRIRSKLN